MEIKQNRIVVKVGTSTLCHSGRGLNLRNIELLARQLTELKNEGFEITLVTSGAIGAGVAKMHLAERPSDLRVKQAVAAIGQLELMHIYDKMFSEYGANVGQILLTHAAIESEKGSENLLGTFEALFSLGVIPIVNENDSVAFEEIESHNSVFGDNDTLSATVAALVGARLLIIISDIDGLYSSDPHTSNNAVLLRDILNINDDIYRLAGGSASDLGTGGMLTKIRAAEAATESGIDVVITNGNDMENIRKAVYDNHVGTRFYA